jgi:cell wall-associated NlpC family hydrolase
MADDSIRANIVPSRARASRKPASLLAAAILCAATSLGTPTARAADDDAAQQRPNPTAELVIRSLSLLGVNYKWGGNTPDTGLDCSGLVRHVYSETIGKVLPRRAVEMSRVGESVDRHSLEPGDLVFFNTLRRAFSHVGIYIGDNQFVHAPARGKTVTIASMDDRYWSRRFNGARRLLAGHEPGPAIAAGARPQLQQQLWVTQPARGAGDGITLFRP